MADDPVAKALSAAKDTLAKANKFTESAEGNATSAFAPKAIPKPKIPQAPHPSNAGYGLAAEARSAGEGITSRMQTEKQALDSLKQK